jgi:DNA-binding XRE family transcriptional regulator
MALEICEKCLGTGHPVDSVLMGEEYKRMRQKAHLTQSRMAELMDIDKSTLCYLEQGKRKWTYYYAVRFNQALALGKSL